METTLVPHAMKKLMHRVRIIGIVAVILAIVLILIFVLSGTFLNLTDGIYFSLVWMLCTVPLVLPGLLYDKVSQSIIQFTDDQVRILDKKGKCWRTIDYGTITIVQVEEVAGFFYGRDKDKCICKYVCVYLNGTTTIPDCSFKKLFSHEDFIMFGYDCDALRYFQQRLSLYKIQSMMWELEE